jgi:hypothetical protein
MARLYYVEVKERHTKQIDDIIKTIDGGLLMSPRRNRAQQK